MAASTFNTRDDDEVRDAGFNEKQARAIIAIQQSARTELATRAEFAGLRADTYRARWIQGVGIITILTALRCRCGAPGRLTNERTRPGICRS